MRAESVNFQTSVVARKDRGQSMSSDDSKRIMVKKTVDISYPEDQDVIRTPRELGSSYSCQNPTYTISSVQLLGFWDTQATFEKVKLISNSDCYATGFCFLILSRVRATTRSSSQIEVTDDSAATARTHFQNLGALSCRARGTNSGTNCSYFGSAHTLNRKGPVNT